MTISLTPLPTLVAPIPVPASLGFGKGAIDKAFIELETALLLNAQSGHVHEFLENPGLRPSAKPAVGGALGAQLGRKILPLGAVIQDPEDRL